MDYNDIHLLHNNSWSFQDSKNYDWCIGRKAFLLTQWDEDTKIINLRNYGIITEITPDYITMQSGKYKNFNNLLRNVFYTHDNIRKFYLKTTYENIRQKVKKINQITDHNEKRAHHILLLNENFITL